MQPTRHALLWVTEFPMFERDSETGRLVALHHPFTAPNQDDYAQGIPLERCRAHAFDLVYNGVEAGGGSLRIHRWVVGSAKLLLLLMRCCISFLTRYLG